MAKRTIPIIICFAVGVFAVIQYFIPALDYVYEYLTQWMLIVTVFALVLGIGSLINHHYNKIKRKVKGWGFSIVTLVGLVGMIICGFFGHEQGTVFQYVYFNVQMPIQATMFSLLAFYIASATFRAFRMRNVSSTLLLLAAIIVMLGQVPIGANMIVLSGEKTIAFMKAMGMIAPDATSVSLFEWLKEWILNIPNMASKRGIVIGVGLGMISTALKIILGIEKTYLGGAG